MNRVKEFTVPGPGEYSSIPGALSGKRAVTGPFRSTSHRPDPSGQKAEALPPGPAFYKPATVGKKSFHLNAHKRFV